MKKFTDGKPKDKYSTGSPPKSRECFHDVGILFLAKQYKLLFSSSA